MSQLTVGDLCITCNALSSVLNNGLLVVIVGIDPTRCRGTTPYRIRRVDGQRLPVAKLDQTGELLFFKVAEVWAPASKLRKIDPDDPAPAQGRAALERLSGLAQRA